jgi:hypothetical protein
MTKPKHEIAQGFFLDVLQGDGYSQEECEAILRGMTISSFKGEMPTDKTQYDKLIASWLEMGRMQ